MARAIALGEYETNDSGELLCWDCLTCSHKTIEEYPTGVFRCVSCGKPFESEKGND